MEPTDDCPIHLQTWKNRHRHQVGEQLQWLWEQPDGIIYSEPAGIHLFMVARQGARLSLALLDQSTLRSELVQSELDLGDPFVPTFEAARAMLWGLGFSGPPQRVYCAGLGGGVLPLCLHHSFPSAVLDCVDIEPQTFTIAERFFGLVPNERVRFHLGEGRRFLENQRQTYDLMLVDVCLGNGYLPYRLFTQEFYHLCRQRLSTRGTLAVKLLRHDRYREQRLKTLCAVFPTVYLFTADSGTEVAIASQEVGLTMETWRERGQEWQRCSPLPFDLATLAVRSPQQWQREVDLGAAVALLRDEHPPGEYHRGLPGFHTLFTQVAAEHPCPCGSGHHFGQCHGQDWQLVS
jgi:spermidine synthase